MIVAFEACILSYILSAIVATSPPESAIESEPNASPFDVIVVGAGPGGSNAAAVALRHGLSVAQVDRSEFPRLKPCGGGVTVKSCNSLQFPFGPTLRSALSTVEFNVWEKRTNRFTHRSSTLLRMVERPQFDNWLVSENLGNERFRFFDGERVVDITYNGIFHVHTELRVLRGRHLVGADGAYSLVNKLFPVTKPKGFAVAVEVTLPRAHATLPEEIPACFDFGVVDSGYGWVFPKDDHWNIGIYTLAKVKGLRDHLRTYIAHKGFHVEGDPLVTFAAHQFPYGGYRINLPNAPVYVVGDAGGFGDPIMGEGIYHALESGRIAGETIVDCVKGNVEYKAYYRRLRRSILLDTFVTYHISREFYRNVDKAITILENPLVWRPFVQGYAEGATFSLSILKGGWFLLKSLLRDKWEYRRTGISGRFSLWGPLRGLAYLSEPIVRRAQRRLRLFR